MDILLVILHADATRGGAERYTLDLAGALVKRGHHVALGARSFASPPSGVRPVNLDRGGIGRMAQYRRFLDALDAHLSDHRYDIVHAMLPTRRCDIYHPHAGIAAELPPRRLSWNPRRRAMAAVEYRLLSAERPPVVLCLSEIIRQTLRRHYPLAEDRAPILFNAVDLLRFNPADQVEAGAELRRRLNIPAEIPLAVMIAQDFARKGLEQTLRAMAVNRLDGGRGFRLIVAGKPDPRAYQRLARKLGIADRVDFIGSVADPRPLYASADLFVLPTRHDPCSLVVLEALAMGVPVITSARNGASEIMTDQVHGIVLDDPDDVPALASAMKRLEDPELRVRMAASCLELRPLLAYQRHLERLLEIYQGCMALSSRPGPT